MGHQRIGLLPQTRKWEAVVAFIRVGAGAAQVAAATLKAASGMLAKAAKDVVFRESLWLLFRLPLAARTEDFAQALRACELDVPDEPDLMDVVAAVSKRLDAITPGGKERSDLGEMAQAAAASTISGVIGEALGGNLFGSEAEDVRKAFAAKATVARFGPLAREFFAATAERCLGYFLSRELGAQVGEGKAFRTLADQEQFRAGLRLHCREAALILDRFAGEWLSAKVREGGAEINREQVAAFAAGAMAKLDAEFRIRGQS